MKTTTLFTTMLCLLLFAFAAHAQQQEPPAEELQRQFNEQLRFLQSPRKQLDEEAQEIAAGLSPWNGQGTWMPLRIIVRSGGENELGLTEEQKQQLPFLYKENELGAEWYQQMREAPTPEYTQAMEALQAAMLPGDPFFERATEEQKNAYREASMMSSNLWWESLQTDIEETLTPEQMLYVRKLEMQLMPALGIPFPSMFDPLDLTDAQKKEMNQIADAMKAEFEQLTREAAALKAERIVSTYQLLQGKTFASRDEFQQSLREVHRQFVPSAEMRKKSEDLQKQGIQFVTLLQNRLMNVLTDEQLDKMQAILDATPEFAKKVLTEFKKRQEEQAKAPDYVPGPDSWRPGMPVPAQFREERQRGNFPRSE